MVAVKRGYTWPSLGPLSPDLRCLLRAGWTHKGLLGTPTLCGSFLDLTLRDPK